MENSLQVIVQESGLEKTKADILLSNFQDYFKVASEWEAKAKTLIVTDENQKAEMQMARTGRLFLKEKRIAIEKVRKELKEQSLREGKAIDGIANVLKALIEPIEEYLDKQEHFVEIKQKEIEEQKRIEEEKRLEEERIAKEKAEAEERERMRIENEKLKKEAEERERERIEREKQVAKEKAEAETKLREQKEAAEKELREQQAKAEAERKEVERQKKLAEDNAKKEAEERKIAEQKLIEEQEKNKNKITCPKCQHTFSL